MSVGGPLTIISTIYKKKVYIKLSDINSTTNTCYSFNIYSQRLFIYEPAIISVINSLAEHVKTNSEQMLPESFTRRQINFPVENEIDYIDFLVA